MTSSAVVVMSRLPTRNQPSRGRGSGSANWKRLATPSRYPAGYESCRSTTPRASVHWVHEASVRWHDPGGTRFVPIQGRPGSRDLRRQGGESPPASVELLPIAGQHAPANPPDGRDRRDGRVDDRPQRGRG